MVPPRRDPARPNAARKKKPGRSGRDDSVRKGKPKEGGASPAPTKRGREQVLAGWLGTG